MGGRERGSQGPLALCNGGRLFPPFPHRPAQPSDHAISRDSFLELELLVEERPVPTPWIEA